MQLIKAILIIAITAGIATWLLPWWFIAVCAFVVVVSCNLRAGKGFVAGFAGISLLWLILMLYRDIPNDHILSAKMAGVLGLPNYGLFIVVTIVLGGLLGGLSGLSAGLMNKAFRK